MNRLLLTLTLTAAFGSLLAFTPTFAQVAPPAKKAEVPPPAKKAARVEIAQGPALEIAVDDLAIVRWTTNNPGGTDDHFGVVHYGTDPKDLSQVAKSEIRINRGHPQTTFRVRVVGLKPQTTYYYTVTSTDSNGNSDGVKSPVNQFTTPGPGERIVAYPPQSVPRPR
jgi:phosphodiesterase/alkaline phosphatase D-like protein